MVYYCDLPVTNPVMVILQMIFVKTFLVTGLVWQYLLFSKITICAFIVIGSSTKFYHGTTIALHSASPTFYQIYHHFRITVKVFPYLINYVWMFTFKSTCIFQITASLTGRSFSTTWFTSAYLISILESSSHQMWFWIVIFLETNNC